MVLIEACPVPKAIAFGAVAAGSINAQLAEIVAGIISNSIGSSADIAAAARMGTSKVVVAVFEVISVKKLTVKQIHNIKTNGGKLMTEVKLWPIISEAPLIWNALAMVRPPANNNNIPQGTSDAVSQHPTPFPNPVNNHLSLHQTE